MIIGFGNNVVSALAGDITTVQTEIPVMPGTGAKFAKLLSADFENKSNTQRVYAKITLTDNKESAFEICHLVSVSGDVLNVIRGQEGTTPKGWYLNDVVANFATRGSENHFVQIAQLQSGHYVSGVAGGTANALTLELPATFFVNGGTDWTLRTPLIVYPTNNNTGSATLQLVMGGRVLGTFPLYKGGSLADLSAGDIVAGAPLICILDQDKSYFSVMNPGAIYSDFDLRYVKKTGDEMSGPLDIKDRLMAFYAGFAGKPDFLPEEQGAWLSWNRVSGGGRVDFICHKGRGNGGFDFWSGNEEQQKLLATFRDNEMVFVAPSPGSGDLGGNNYTPIIASSLNNRGAENSSIETGAIFGFRLKEIVGSYHEGIFCLEGFGSRFYWNMRSDGSFRSPSSVYAADACMAGDGNVYGSMWGGWLSDYLNSRAGISSIRLGASAEFKERGNSERMVGGVMTSWADTGTSNYWIRLRPLQYFINGTWVTAAYE